jgi:2-methylisocitrate lyase-like PEP mutase family enzyme
LTVNRRSGIPQLATTFQDLVLEELGYKLVIYPAIALMAAIRAIELRLQLLLESGIDQAVDAEEAPLPIFRKMGLDFWQEIERKYQ